MTLNGPEPKLYVNSAIDYDCYIDLQLAPIADATLSVEESSLVLRMDKQVGLFD